MELWSSARLAALLLAHFAPLFCFENRVQQVRRLMAKRSSSPFAITLNITHREY